MDESPPLTRLQDRYVLRERLGTGGMATVWLAHDELLARPVALKILRDDLARDPEFLERFRREAIAAARLSHPRIVRVYDTGTDGTTCFIVMELVDGTSLSTILEAGPLDPPRAAAVIAAALEGLGHAHDEGLVHRDVKPGNVLLGSDGQVKVADFGVAKAAFTGGDLTATGKILGTVRYLSPEQVEGKAADARSDLYSAGIVLYEALTGRVPFLAETDLATAMLRLSDEPMPPGAVRAGIPRHLERAVMTALARSPDDRFASADDMRRAVLSSGTARNHARTVAMAPSETREAPPGGSHRQPSMFRSWMLVPLLAILLGAIAVVVGLLLGRLTFGGPLGVRPADPTPNPPAARALSIGSATDYDPQGDGSENGDAVAGVLDGDPGTVWTTEGYNSPNLGGLKSGVGILLDLGSAAQVSRVVVDSPLPGWAFEVHAGESPTGLQDAPARSAMTGGDSFTAATRDDVAFRPFRARYVLLWITQLARSADRFRAAISRVQILGAGG